MKSHKQTFLALATLLLPATAQSSCSTSLTPSNSIQPSVASGFRAQLVATGLSGPRSLQFDSAGNLLVVERGTGSISAISFNDNGGTCLEVNSKTSVIENQGLNHGIALSSDGRTLYASSSGSAWSWDYDADNKSVSSQRLLVTGMSNNDHTTRTLLLSQMSSDMLLISRGSQSNIDLEATVLDSGHSQIRAFNINNITDQAYDYADDGLRLGWGLRNSVGVAEHPITGGIYSVENSADQIERNGQDIHQDNPAEEMNFHGYLNGTEYTPQGQNYGYPLCFSAWNVTAIPENSNLTVGSQFAIDGSDGQNGNDTYCAAQVPPRLSFQAHMAPLDMKFNNSGTEAWVTFHGSWDRTSPVGYKLSVIPFANGEPVADAENNTAAADVFSNANLQICPGNCFRPVGIAIDQQGRLFMSSDSTGEVYVVVRDQAANTTSTTSDGTGFMPISYYWVGSLVGILMLLVS